jgi:hypothetical protein
VGKLIVAVIVGFVVLVGAVIVSSSGGSKVRVGTLTTTGMTDSASKDGWKWTSFVGKTSDSALFITWHRTGSSVGGIAMEDVVTRQPLHEGTSATNFTGTISGNQVAIHFQGQGLDYMTSLRGRINGRGFTATAPGDITPIRFRAASIQAYARAANQLAGFS